MLLGLVVHSAITYGLYEDLGSWPIRDSVTHLSNDFIVVLIHSFRMQIFFLVSGFFGSMLFYDKNPLAMIKNRISRIILPFIVFIILLWPAIVFGFGYSMLIFSGETNPIHHHSGQITWVIYLETPDLEKEREQYQGRSVGPGGICFHYGEPQFPEWATHTYGCVPKKGDIWIFPALLRHEVIPFKSEGVRISVSGNFFYKNPNEKSGIIETAIDQDAKHPRA